jgi:hypothetical protein
MTNVIAAVMVVLEMAGSPFEGVPPNIAIPTSYRAVVAEMYRYSPTFRRQCHRLGRASDVRVRITASVLHGMSPDAALTRIVRDRAGGIDAGVELGVSGDLVTLIAHEFEHILEQLDGVDLPVMATRTASGVYLVPGSGHFETERAIAAGRQVADEVKWGRERARHGT